MCFLIKWFKFELVNIEWILLGKNTLLKFTHLFLYYYVSSNIFFNFFFLLYSSQPNRTLILIICVILWKLLNNDRTRYNICCSSVWLGDEERIWVASDFLIDIWKFICICFFRIINNLLSITNLQYQPISCFYKIGFSTKILMCKHIFKNN